MYELRNLTSSNKKVELKLVSDGPGGVDNGFAEGANFLQGDWCGTCLAPAVIPDSMYFIWFPDWDYWGDGPHWFDIEINGVLYDMTNVGRIGHQQTYPPELAELNNLLRIWHTDFSIERVMFRNISSNVLNIKLIYRNDGTLMYSEVPPYRIADDNRNSSIKYHPNKDIEFTLNPYIPFDQVSEENKLILEMALDYNPSSSEMEWGYLEFSTAGGLHPSDYLFIDWGDGSTTHHKFAEMIDGEDWNKSEDYFFHEWQPAGTDRVTRTIKIHTNVPMGSVEAGNIVRVVNFGSYVAEEMYNFGDRSSWDLPQLFSGFPRDIPWDISWFEVSNTFANDAEIDVTNLNSGFTFYHFNTWFPNYATNYSFIKNFIDYDNYVELLDNAKITWGTYPDQYPCLAFTDLDQLAISFKTVNGSGKGLNVTLDFKSAEVGKLIGPSRPNNISNYVKFIKNSTKDEYTYLVDLKAYKDNGGLITDFLLYFRGCWVDSVISGRIITEFIGWIDSSVTLTTDGLQNVPAVANYQASIDYQCLELNSDPLYPGSKFGVVHYDPHLSMVSPKTMKHAIYTPPFVEISDESLDTLVIRGEPGLVYTLTAGNSPTLAEQQTYQYRIGDDGFAYHQYTITDADYYYNGGLKAKHPSDFIQATPFFDPFERTVKLSTRTYPVDVMFKVDGVQAADISVYSDRENSLPLYPESYLSTKVIQADVIYTSTRTGLTYQASSRRAGHVIVTFEPEDVIKLEIPSSLFYFNTTNLLTIGTKNVGYYARYNTPEETPRYPASTFWGSNDLNTFNYAPGTTWIGVNGWDLRDTAQTSQIVEIILYDTTTYTADKGRYYARSNRTHLVKQFGTGLKSWRLSSNQTSTENVFDGQLVPTYLPPNITDLESLFYAITNLNTETMAAVAQWDVSHVESLYQAFSSSNFNGDISGWNTEKVSNMFNMMRYNTTFNQNLSQWCVPLLPTLPSGFAQGATLFTVDKRPVWGTCPRGENLV